MFYLTMCSPEFNSWKWAKCFKTAFSVLGNQVYLQIYLNSWCLLNLIWAFSCISTIDIVNMCIFLFYRRGSWFIFQGWTGRTSESGGQTTKSEQRKESCNAPCLDAEQVQEVISTSAILTPHHALPDLCLFILCYLFVQSWKYFFLPNEYVYDNKTLCNKPTKHFKQSGGVVWFYIL